MSILDAICFFRAWRDEQRLAYSGFATLTQRRLGLSSLEIIEYIEALKSTLNCRSEAELFGDTETVAIGCTTVSPVVMAISSLWSSLDDFREKLHVLKANLRSEN